MLPNEALIELHRLMLGISDESTLAHNKVLWVKSVIDIFDRW